MQYSYDSKYPQEESKSFRLITTVQHNGCVHKYCTQNNNFLNDENYTDAEKKFIEQNNPFILKELQRKELQRKPEDYYELFRKGLGLKTTKQYMIERLRKLDVSERPNITSFDTVSLKLANNLRIFANYNLDEKNTSLFAIMVHYARSWLCLAKNQNQTAQDIWSCFEDTLYK